MHDFSKGNKESSVTGFGIGKIIDSKNPAFPVGSTFFGPIRWESYSRLTKDQGLSEAVNLDAGLDKDVPSRSTMESLVSLGLLCGTR